MTRDVPKMKVLVSNSFSLDSDTTRTFSDLDSGTIGRSVDAFTIVFDATTLGVRIHQNLAYHLKFDLFGDNYL